jgi:hypothetical protein
VSVESPKIFVLKFRGGPAHGVYRLARDFVPGRLTVRIEETGELLPYTHRGEEPQARDVYTYDRTTKETRRARVVDAFYQIFVPEEVQGRG